MFKNWIYMWLCGKGDDIVCEKFIWIFIDFVYDYFYEWICDYICILLIDSFGGFKCLI